MFLAASFMLHLQCSGSLLVSLESFSTSAEVWVRDLPSSNEKQIAYQFSYGRGEFSRSEKDSLNIATTDFFAAQTDGSFTAKGLTASSGVVTFASNVNFGTLVTLAQTGQAVLVLTEGSENAVQYLHCKSVP
jgi:hypothetical protein